MCELRTLFCLALFILLGTPSGMAQKEPEGMHPKNQIDFVKKQLNLKREPYLSAYKMLLEKADLALASGNHAVEDFSIPGYYSDKEGHKKTSLALQSDGFSAYSCALAYRLSGKRKYADKALYFLKSWANINKKYSQLDGSLVMSYSGTTLMIAADLLRDYKGWKQDDQTQFRQWTINVFRHAANSIRFRGNNSGDWSRLASLLADVYLNDKKDFQKNVELVKKDLFDKISPDGHMVEEVKRQAKGIWYTYFSLAPLTACSWIIFNQTGENLFIAERNGASFKKALDYLLYYNQHPAEWKYFKNPETGFVYTETGVWPANLLEAMNGIYRSKDFDDFVSTYRPIMYPKHDYAWTFPTLMPLSLTGYVAQKNTESKPPKLKSDGYKLVWAEEFNYKGAPDNTKWKYEKGFERNEEFQWYQEENARCENGNLIIEGRREDKANPNFIEGSTDWKKNRSKAEYTSSSIKTQGLHSWCYGRFVMRGKIDVRDGIWPAWWTLGIKGRWPATGEIDIMEYYRKKLLANIAYMGKNGKDAWFMVERNIDSFGGEDWAREFHVWRMDWDEKGISLYVDDQLLNHVDMDQLGNQDGSDVNPFKQPHYMLLNLAIGGKQGGDPSKTSFPARFVVDYVRVYQK